MTNTQSLITLGQLNKNISSGYYRNEDRFHLEAEWLDTLEVNQAIESLIHRASLNNYGQYYTTINDIVDTFVGYCHGIGNDSKKDATRKANAYINICNM